MSTSKERECTLSSNRVNTLYKLCAVRGEGVHYEERECTDRRVTSAVPGEVMQDEERASRNNRWSGVPLSSYCTPSPCTAKAYEGCSRSDMKRFVTTFLEAHCFERWIQWRMPLTRAGACPLLLFQFTGFFTSNGLLESFSKLFSQFDRALLKEQQRETHSFHQNNSCFSCVLGG